MIDTPTGSAAQKPPCPMHGCKIPEHQHAGTAARRPLRVNGKPIPPDIANGSPGDFARFCGETDPAVLAILDAEEEDVD